MIALYAVIPSLDPGPPPQLLYDYSTSNDQSVVWERAINN